MSGWLDIDDAPINVPGHVWSPAYPERTDLQGTIYEFNVDGKLERHVTGNGNTGMTFTKWHPFPEPPQG